jgi:hypothetical protein
LNLASGRPTGARKSLPRNAFVASAAIRHLKTSRESYRLIKDNERHRKKKKKIGAALFCRRQNVDIQIVDTKM